MTSVVLFFAGLIYANVLFFVDAIWSLNGDEFIYGIIKYLLRAYMVVGTGSVGGLHPDDYSSLILRPDTEEGLNVELNGIRRELRL